MIHYHRSRFLFIIFNTHDTVTLGRGTGMGIRESDGELKDTFDTAITSMKEDGSLNELLIKWFGEGTDTY